MRRAAIPKAFKPHGARGQSTIECALLVAILLAAVLAIQVYVKRGIMGRYKQLFESAGDPYVPKGTTTTPEVLVQSGTSSDTVSVRKVKKAGVDYRETRASFRFDTTVSEQGGETVTVDASKGLFK